MIVVVVCLILIAFAFGWYGRGIFENLTGYDKIREKSRQRESSRNRMSGGNTLL